MWDTQVPPRGQEDPLEKETATRSSILAWKIPWTEEPGRLQSKELDPTERLHFLTERSYRIVYKMFSYQKKKKKKVAEGRKGQWNGGQLIIKFQGRALPTTSFLPKDHIQGHILDEKLLQN